MYLIVGLGNPGKEYEKTRHNMGFNTINKIAKEYEIGMTKQKFNGIYGTGSIENEKVILLKPQTFMNSSGDSIIQFKNFYKIENNQVIVIYDDLDLEKGTIKIRKKGSAGTHNGMKSVVYRLNTEEFARIRVGIGKEDEVNLIDYVIGAVSEEEQKILDTGTDKAKDALVEILKSGIDSAMNKYN